MANNWEIMGAQRLTTILDELRDVREMDADLRFLDRTPMREVTDEELMGRFRGDVLISDIITVGAKAIVKNTDRFTTENWTIPKIKHGVRVDEHMLNVLNRITAGGGVGNDRGLFTDYLARKENDILRGIRQRLNALCVAMDLDAFSYSMGGVIITNASWNVPAPFKSTPLVPWSTAATATPIMDISRQAENDRIYYGEVRNRITMSTTALNLIFATDEFRDKARLYSQWSFADAMFPLTAEMGPQLNILQTILGMPIELEDARYWDQLPNGDITSAPYLPPNKVILSNTADDNSEAAAFIGNAIVPETQVSAFVDVGGADFGGVRSGPVSYSEGSLNPPELNIWGVQKAWPIRVRQGKTSVLTVY